MRIGAVKMRNQIETENRRHFGMKILISIKKDTINHKCVGFYGHILNVETGACVYISYSEQVCLEYQVLYRLAEGPKDWSSNRIKNGFNRYTSIRSAPKDILNLLKKESERINKENA